ncbi:MAG: 5-bromo-4-chloroindolyl phosphate hydrolysis family protein [Alphaproteobacteria bacterium]
MSNHSVDRAAEMKYRARRMTRKFSWAMAGIWLWILPLPLIGNAIWMLARGNLRDVLISLGCYAVFGLSGWLVRQATALEARALGDPLGRAPVFPFRTVAALLAGLATFVTAGFLAYHNLWMSLAFAVGAIAGVLVAYGFDRFGAQVSLPTSADDAVFEALDKARASLGELRRMKMNMSNREFRDRLGRLEEWGDKIIKLIKEDKRDLKRAREFINVYLDGAVKVTATYVKTHGHTGDQAEALESRFSETLEGMEREFEAQHQRLLKDDILDLDVELELLTSQLKQKGML